MQKESMTKLSGVFARKLTITKCLEKIFFSTWVLQIYVYFLVSAFSLKVDQQVLQKYYCQRQFQQTLKCQGLQKYSKYLTEFYCSNGAYIQAKEKVNASLLLQTICINFCFSIIIESTKTHASEVYIFFYTLALMRISPYDFYLILDDSLEHNIFFKMKQIAKRNYF